MKGSVFTFVLCLIAAGSLYAQEFNRTAASADKAYAGEKTTVTVEGDINKDGIKDLVVAVPEEFTKDNFAFYFGDKGGGYTLFRDYAVDFYGAELKLSITDAGVVRIENDLDGGADIFLFRFENGDFRLIGGKEDRHKTSADYDVSYNYLTGKMIRTDGTGKGRKSTTLDMPKLPKIHFGWIPLRYDMLHYLLEENEEYWPTAEDILVMGIFRVMQANEMLFWHFCDYDNPSRNPHPTDEGCWYAYDDYMSPGSYNYYATLDIQKRPDGAYLINMFEAFTDRSFEADIDWEAEGEIDLPENAYEEEVSEGGWIFKDGKFTEVASGE